MGHTDVTVFDNVPRRETPLVRERNARRTDPEDARIALRCNRKELELIDSFVANGEFESRSELLRAAMHALLRSRSLSSEVAPARDSEGYVEVPVRMRPHELAEWQAFARLVENGQPVRDVLARAIRELAAGRRIRDTVAYHREGIQQAAARQEQESALSESGKNLERKGVLGR